MSGSERFGSLWDLLEVRVSNSSSLEDKLKRWAQAPSATEIEKCERSVRMIKAAIADDPKLSQRNDISVFAKGSYANRTNIPSDSDVDVAVLLTTNYLNDYPAGTKDSDFNFVPSTYTHQEFRADLDKAIIAYFGSKDVTIGTKATQVHASSARVDADVVAQSVHRRYVSTTQYYEGVALKTPDGTIIYNWPQQDYDNGVAKNEATGKRYKALTRILKNLRCAMKDKGMASADVAASYLIACLVYNLPDYFFEKDTYVQMTEDALVYLVERTSDLNNVSKWTEVNGMKWLFSSKQSWKIDKVHTFLVEALNHFRGLK